MPETPDGSKDPKARRAPSAWHVAVAAGVLVLVAVLGCAGAIALVEVGVVVLAGFWCLMLFVLYMVGILMMLVAEALR